VQCPQRPVHIAGGLVLDDEDGAQHAVDRQKHTGLQLQVVGQRHLLLAHEIRAAHGDGLAPDHAGHAALLAEAQVIHTGGEPALRRQLLAKQGRQLAVRRLRHPGGVGEHLDALLAIDLVAVERHRAGGEQVVLRHQQLAAAAQRQRPGIARQRAAAPCETVL